jgi:hypothetical protein
MCQVPEAVVETAEDVEMAPPAAASEEEQEESDGDDWEAMDLDDLKLPGQDKESKQKVGFLVLIKSR